MIWVFAACVSLCAEHDGGESQRAEARPVVTPGFAEMQECCPAGETSCGVPADRATYPSHPSDAEPSSEAVAVRAADVALAHPARGVPPEWAADPPFERLRTLRI